MRANRIGTAREILLAAPGLQRAQPRLRYQLARVDFRAGQYARGLATLDALLDDGTAHDDPVFRARVLNARGAMLIRLGRTDRSEEHTSELQSLMRISYAVFCLKQKILIQDARTNTHNDDD